MLNKSEEKASVEPIDKTGKTGLTGEKKEVLKKMIGSVSIPIDLNKIREKMKYDAD